MPQNKQQIMCETWNQSCKVLCSQSLCRLVAEGGGKAGGSPIPSAQQLLSGRVQAEPHLAFPGGGLVLTDLASGWLGRPRCCSWAKKWQGEAAWNIQEYLGDVLVLGALKQHVRGSLIHLTASCGGRFFCARRGFFPAGHKLQRRKSIGVCRTDFICALEKHGCCCLVQLRVLA